MKNTQKTLHDMRMGENMMHCSGIQLILPVKKISCLFPIFFLRVGAQETLGLDLLVIYNLSPWLCMNWKYIMLSIMISSSNQPVNDIDVYLSPLIEDF